MSRRSFAVVAVAALAVGLVTGCMTDSGDEDAGTTMVAELPSLYEGYESEQYAGTTNWICHPDSDDDLCDQNLDATVLTTDGLGDVEEFVRAEDPSIDCFYVYPTISDDETIGSDLDWSPDEEGFAVLNQAARLGQECRVFVPAYRSVTNAGLAAAIAGQRVEEALAARETGYGDIVDAWKQYMANENDGRGVVLVGHSQGAGMLMRLITEEIDGDVDVRDRIVSAYLAGLPPVLLSGVETDEFEHLPRCTTPEEYGCVVAWASFEDTVPPDATSAFGLHASGPVVGSCANPAAVGGGSATSVSYLPAPAAALFGTEVDTGFIRFEMIDTECAATDTVSYLSATYHEAAGVAAYAQSNPSRGTHLLDISIVQGDMIELIATQADAWLAAHT